MSTRHPMPTADAAWLHMDRPTNLMVINAVLWFDAPLDWARTRATVLERLVEPFPPFRRRVREGGVLAGPSWEDDPDFDLDLHLHRLALPPPGDQAALQEVVGDLITRPLDLARPLWEMHLLEGYGSGCALVVRMHHCIADGIALARVMLSLTDLDGERGGFAPTTAGDHGRIGGLAHLAGAIAHEGLETARHPGRVAALARRAADDAPILAKQLLPGFETASSLKGEQHIRHGVAWSAPVRLETVKAAGHALDATVNDVLVAAVAGAIGRELRRRGEQPTTLHMMVPFNLRPLDEPLPAELGNQFGLVLLELPVGVEDPVQRVREVHAAMAAIKQSDEGPISYGILQAMGRTPAGVEARLIDFFTAKATMVMTNVPGPRATVSLAGTPVRGVLVWAPCSGSVGMSVSVFSYAGKVTVGFLADAGLVPEPDRLAAHFRAEMRAISRRARAAAAPAAAG
jgi:diacylglycerol O-acyltransferase / wax synthase